MGMVLNVQEHQSTRL